MLRRWKRSLFFIGLMLFGSTASAINLLQVYQLAAKNDSTYQAARETYAANKENVPIALANLLPSLTLTGSTVENKADGQDWYWTNSYTLTLTQALFDIGDLAQYEQSKVGLIQAALTYAQAKQTLIQNVITDYVAVLKSQDQLRYAKQFQEQLKEQMAQSLEQYKVGLKAFTDVQTTRAQYESAIADTVQAKNEVDDAHQELDVLTGTPVRNLAELKQSFPLLTPKPNDPNRWIAFGAQHNLALQIATFQAKFDKRDIYINFAGTDNHGAITPGFIPIVNAHATYNISKNESSSDGLTNSGTIGVTGTWNIFNGGSTVANVTQSTYTYHSDLYSQEASRRSMVSSINQDFLNITSDISQIQALRQAIISGEASLKATRAAYQVGTNTIVDLLEQQSNLFQDQQNYADALYQYINDTIQLKLDAGTLTGKDIIAINGLLKSATN